MKRKYIKSILIKYLIFYNDLRKEKLEKIKIKARKIKSKVFFKDNSAEEEDNYFK